MTMTEGQFDATEHGRAIDSFIKTTITLGVVLASAELGSLVTNQLRPFAGWAIENGARFGVDPEVVENLVVQQKYLDMLDPGLDQAVRSSAIIIGACSAIEAYVEQFTKSRIREDPSLLDGTSFDATTIAAKKSLTDPDEIFERQWRAIKASPRDEPNQHKRFETVLTVVGRDGATPPLIETSVNTAYAVRNVWAHNAGYADAMFAAKAPSDLRFSTGELVNLSRKEGARYLSVVMTYGMIVANRERASLGLGPIPMDGKPGETDYGRAYNAM